MNINLVDGYLEGDYLAAPYLAGPHLVGGMQAAFTIESELPLGNQALVQVLSQVGQEVRVDEYPTLECIPGYLKGEPGYLTGPYLRDVFCLSPGSQATFVINQIDPQGQQTTFTIDAYRGVGQQATGIIKRSEGQGHQIKVLQLNTMGQQVLATYYNSVNLRVLCEYPSRGVAPNNWTATNTAPGDFSVQNLNTDIVEQVYRSETGTTFGLRLSCDTGLPQGVFLDTLGILNSNFSPSASVALIGSNDPGFAVTEFFEILDVGVKNTFYISEELPKLGFRYWAIDIEDPTNSDNFIEVGTVVFGASAIFQGECFVDEVEFKLKDFTDSVVTEGFTSVANSRALKRSVRLDFRFLNFQKNNFKIMRNLFETYRTTHKCLWIPTPDIEDQEVTSRFAAYAKLTSLPSERHKYLGGDADYVSFTLEYDESK